MKKNEQNEKSVAKICPLCGRTYAGHPALSREDNCTKICGECGVRQAMSNMGVDAEETEKVLDVMRKAHAI